ncbi:MAG: PfkB family carbohydrate kinase [Candidatus Hodarchaeales archaeon]|jgi:sugar/nucleoside kinase (ribokinase family)
MLTNNIPEFQKRTSKLTVSVLPDFYIDVVIDPHRSFKDLDKQLQEVYARGGGNIIGTKVKFVPGGNGGNVAKTLAALGVETSFLTQTSEFGLNVLEYFMKPLGINLKASATGNIASSVILELSTGTRDKSNIMLSSAGSVANFSSSSLTTDQWAVLRKSKVIALTNAQNLEMEDLTEGILQNTPKETIVSLDFSDLTPHQPRIAGFRERLLNHPTRPPNLILGNENEFKLLANLPKGSATEAGQTLSIDFPEIFFALHTANQVYLWYRTHLLATQKCHLINLQHATGAGDAWHAGFLVGWQVGLSYKDTMSFANAVSGYQLSTGEVGSLPDILRFMKETPLQETDQK